MSSQDKGRQPTYPGGIQAVLSQMEGRRDAFSYAPGEGLPPPNIVLEPLAQACVTDPRHDPEEQEPARSSYARKRRVLRQEFAGASELCCLNGLLIAHLRKREVPDHAAPLFLRLWTEQAPHLLAHLNPRWLVSSITTFGDHGATPVQRSVGLALSVLFGTMKLYETERLYSGLPPERAFALDAKVKATLATEMDAYAITAGGLDVNMLGRLWQEAQGDAVIAPLAHHLLDLLIHDDRTLFRRLMTMRKRKLRQEASKPIKRGKQVNMAPVPTGAPPVIAQNLRWGLVSTIKAPLPQIARFAAHHLDLGAAALHLYLDVPDVGAADWLSRHPRIHVTQCDAAYWHDAGKPRMEAHQLRQAFNATRTLRAASDDLDWLGHTDVDEYLLTDAPICDALAQIDPDVAVARLRPAEALATDSNLQPQHFKLTHKGGGVPKATLQDIYPTFGLHLYGGFLSHTSGKVFARTGIPDTRLGIHTLKYKGEEASNAAPLPDVFLGHFHAPNWDHFRHHFDFRRRHGSYRPRTDKGALDLSDIIAYLAETEGEDGLRALFDEVAQDSAELRARLAAHGMLVTHPLDPDAAVLRVFGELP
ncbi:glycosyltransferase family 2 protein [Puniceibacterium sp. IMCC21224]|uniref:glycosyltransferase family 2 protein n=1 Tax=Puniceibacterium sp. IMCC21224 TaxID=1618204 RepID=UPI00065D275C|nr:glycosyltransferase family 2 protein [Puniceibacterium sp. IMCC21224]KMK67089.1 Glycosyl transferase family 2 [Puniceibacterium sp. IMCC21224]